MSDGERSEQPAVLDYGRPPPSRMASVWTRVGIFFVLGVMFFACAVLGGYAGHVLSPRPRFYYGLSIQLPIGTTPQTSAALNSAVGQLRDPNAVARALRAKNLDGGDSPAGLYKRMSLSVPNKKIEPSEIGIGFEDTDARRAVAATQALVGEMDTILTYHGQPHELNWLRQRWRGPHRIDSALEPWLIGGGVLIGLLVPTLALRLLWKPFSQIGARAELSEAVWTQGPR